MTTVAHVGSVMGFGGTSWSITVGAGGVPAGAYVVVISGTTTRGASPSRVNDSKKNGYQLVWDSTDLGTGFDARIFAFIGKIDVPLVNGDTITYTANSNTVSGRGMTVAQITDYPGAALAFDTAASAGQNGGNSPASGNTGSTTQDVEAVLGGEIHIVGNTTTTPDGSYTLLNDASSGTGLTDARLWVGYKVTSSKGTQAWSGTLSTTRDNAAICVVVKSVPFLTDMVLPEQRITAIRSRGKVWGPFMRCKPPTPADFPIWLAQGSATLTPNDRGVVLYTPGVGNVIDYHAVLRNLPPPPYTIGAYIHVNHLYKQWPAAGIVIYDSGGGASITYALDQNLAPNKWNSTSSFNANYTAWGVEPESGPVWLIIRDDGTTRFYMISWDGVFYNEYYHTSRTDFVTPNQWGFWVSAQNVATPNMECSMQVYSWLETTP